MQKVVVISLLLFASSIPSALAAACEACPSNCCCACEYRGRASCGGSTAWNRCESNQTAHCSCSAAGCIDTCSTNTNQGVGPDSRFHSVSLSETTLNGICDWLASVDPTWGCRVVAQGGERVSRSDDLGGVDLDGALDAVGADFEACADVDYTEKKVMLRPSGSCL